MTVVPLNLQRWIEGRLENSGWDHILTVVPESGGGVRRRIRVWLSHDGLRLAIVWPHATRVIDLTVAPEHNPEQGEYHNGAMGLSVLITRHGRQEADDGEQAENAGKERDGEQNLDGAG